MFHRLYAFIQQLLSDSVFAVEIRHGHIRTVRGKTPRGFVSDLREVVRLGGFGSGVIRGKQRHGQVSLVFSGEIPDYLHQRMRNIWELHASSR